MVNPEIKQKGFWFEDEFISYIRGYYDFESTNRDFSKFSKEIRGASNSLFPLTLNQNDFQYFDINCESNEVKDIIVSYFLTKKGYSSNREKIYSNAYTLSDFLTNIMKDLIIYGESYCVIDWEKPSKNLPTYIFPKFRYLHPSTMSKSLDNTGSLKYKQSYSMFSNPYNRLGTSSTTSFNFDNDEIFHLTYPLDPIHPVKKSMGLLKRLDRIMSFGLESGEAQLQASNHRLDFERTRYTTFTSIKRENDIARAKVRKNFHYLLNVSDLNITEFYDIYLVTKYKQDLNSVRDYLINCFNEQVLTAFAEKNNLDIIPKIILNGFLTNSEIEQYFEDYKNGKLDKAKYIEKVVKPN